MRNSRFLFIGMAFALLTLPAPLSAEDEPVQGELDIVVTATKTNREINEVPASVTVISSEDLEKKKIRTVDDALRTLSGVFAKRTKGLMDSTASVNLRGFYGDKYTLVLLDGQPLNDAYTGGLDWNSLPVDNIERIEVVRGASSALYGGNAMGGVINIITKSSDEPFLNASGGFGSNSTRKTAFSTGDTLGDRVSYRVGYVEEETDGYRTTPVLASVKEKGDGNVAGGYPMNDKKGLPTRWVVGDKGDNGAAKRVIDAKIDLELTDTGRLTLSGVTGRSEYDYGPPATYMGTFGEDYAIAGDGKQARFRPNDFINYAGIGRTDTETYTLGYEEIFGETRFNLKAGTVLVDSRYTNEDGSKEDNYYDSKGKLSITESENRFGEIGGERSLGDSHVLSVGASYREDFSDSNSHPVPFYRSFSGKGQSTFYAGGESDSWAVFLQDEWEITDPFTLYLGLRYDSWRVHDGASGDPWAKTHYRSNDEKAFSPKVAAVWKAADNTTLRASIGHAFRAPTLYELYKTWSSWGSTYKSNPNLEPETTWTYETGIEQYLFDDKTRLSLTGYFNDIEDLIYYQVDGKTKTRKNAGEARTYGLEFELSQEISDWFTLWGNYTYTDTKITKNPTDMESENKRFTGVPKTVWNLGVDAGWSWLNASVQGHYFSKIYNDPHNMDDEEGVYGTYEPSLVVDASLKLIPRDRMEVSLSVDNLFDRKHYEYYRTDGRTYFAEVSLKY